MLTLHSEHGIFMLSSVLMAGDPVNLQRPCFDIDYAMWKRCYDAFDVETTFCAGERFVSLGEDPTQRAYYVLTTSH